MQTTFFILIPVYNFKILTFKQPFGSIQVGNMECIEPLERAKTIRLRTHNGKFLVADDDEKSVRQDRDGSTRRAQWTVEFMDDKQNIVCLKSCYGKYLTASNKPFLPKMNAFKVIQTLPKRLTSSQQWEIERDGIRIRLRTRYGQFLRPYGGLPLWRNWVSHDIPFRTSSESKLLWDFDVVETQEKQFITESGSIQWPPNQRRFLVPSRRQFWPSLTIRKPLVPWGRKSHSRPFG